MLRDMDIWPEGFVSDGEPESSRMSGLQVSARLSFGVRTPLQHAVVTILHYFLILCATAEANRKKSLLLLCPECALVLACNSSALHL